MSRHTVLFQPDNVLIEVDDDIDLATAARQADIEIRCGCGGEGACGDCLMRVVSGPVRTEVPPACDGFTLACQTRVAGDVVVEIPPSSRLVEHQVLVDSQDDGLATDVLMLPAGFRFDPIGKKISLQLTPPSLMDPGSDVSRLTMALEQAAGLRNVELELSQVRAVTQILRSSDWQVDVTYIKIGEKAKVIGIEPRGSANRLLGLAVDVGTTTVAVFLVDLLSGTVVGKEGTHNKQAKFGDDVITRIIHASEEDEGLEDLQQAIAETVNDLTAALVAKHGICAGDIRAVVTAGNTTMAHLLLGLQPRYIRLEPFVPVASRFPCVKAGELGLRVHPDAPVFSFPAVASFVGGDIVAGVLANGMAEEEPLTLFIDIGTNGEMVLGNRDWLVGCACSAGPAFEGAGISHGVRAMQGAIERLAIDRATFEVTYSTIGGTKPLGICGSGLIDALAKMRRAGVIDRAGKMQDLATPRIRKAETGIEFVLAWADETAGGRDLVITEADVKNLLRAKGAVYAGLRSLLKTVDMEMASIERVYIAGGFGSYLNIADAVEIGLLPDIGSAKYHFIGNTSVKGAYAGLVASAVLPAAEALAERITYLELAAGNLFMEEFIAALFLPHTDLGLFPSLQ
ncbi:MAG: ASKHA domain-containing protein [Negativicutes bacterium]|nr:ASKHA domain-containing protein [Negativicutes bacterium]